MDENISVYFSDASRLLKGFKCYELAYSLDSNGIVFYMAYNPENNYAILGCRLIVQRADYSRRKKGRMFIEKVPIKEINAGRIFEFYKRAKREVESIEYYPCKVLGLYEKGDIEKLKVKIDERIVKVSVSKFIAGEPIRIECQNAAEGISLIAEIIDRIKKEQGFNRRCSFVVSFLPGLRINADISIKITGKKAQILGMPETPPKEEKKESEKEISEQPTETEEKRVRMPKFGVPKISDISQKRTSAVEEKVKIYEEKVNKLIEKKIAIEEKLKKLEEYSDEEIEKDLNELEKNARELTNKLVTGAINKIQLEKYEEATRYYKLAAKILREILGDEKEAKFYEKLADVSKVPIMLHNAQARTGIDMAPETTAHLAKHPNIIGIKDGNKKLDHLAKVIHLTRNENFEVFTGKDTTAFPFVRFGGSGSFTVAGNVIPKVMKNMLEIGLSKEFPKAEKLHNEFYDLFEALRFETNPMAAKKALNLMKLPSGGLRLPLTELSDSKTKILKKIMSEKGLI